VALGAGLEGCGCGVMVSRRWKIERGFGLLGAWRSRDNSAAYQPLSARTGGPRDLLGVVLK
jgi:transposase